MRILYLSPREAWPLNSGAKLRDYHLARGLAQAADVTYLFFGGEAAARELHGTPVAAPRKYTPGMIVRGLLGAQPLSILNYTSRDMESAVQSLRAESFDIVHLESIHMTGYLGAISANWPQAIVTLDWHNVESEAMDRFAATTPSLPRRLYAQRTAGQLRRVENLMLATLYGHLVCSERERTLLQRRYASARIAVIENGVDTGRFRASQVARTPRLIFVGQMSYGPNVEGAVWFVNEIWPSLRRRFPDLWLSIVGADPSPAVQALGSQQGITVTGTVPDVRSYYEGALAAIVPLRSGAGTRLKILEAMAAEVPVISTALGAEGLAVADKQHLLIAELAASWIRAVESIMLPERAQRLTQAARQLVVARYDWSVIGRNLVETYREWSRRN